MHSSIKRFIALTSVLQPIFDETLKEDNVRLYVPKMLSCSDPIRASSLHDIYDTQS